MSSHQRRIPIQYSWDTLKIPLHSDQDKALTKDEQIKNKLIKNLNTQKKAEEPIHKDALKKSIVYEYAKYANFQPLPATPLFLVNWSRTVFICILKGDWLVYFMT